MANNTGYDKTPVPAPDYDVSKVPEPIRRRSNWTRTKFTGDDVLESVAQIGEIAGLYAGEAKQLAERTQFRQDAVEDFNTQVIQEMTDKDVISAPEIIEARGGKPNLKARLDDTTTQLTSINKLYSVNLGDFQRNLPENDDTGRFNRAISALESLNTHVDFPDTGYDIRINNTLFLPDEVYEIGSTLTFSKSFNLIAQGQGAVIKMSDASSNIIEGYVGRCFIYGVTFSGGKHQVYLSNGNIDATILTIANCEFKFSSDYAVKTWGTWKPEDFHLSAHTSLFNCRFMEVNGAVFDVSDYCTIVGGWIYVSKQSMGSNRAVFVNRSGQMTLDTVLGVPTMGFYPDHSLNSRWTDNYGIIKIFNCRFGGEDGGMPTVYNFAGSLADGMGSAIHIEYSQLFPGNYFRYKDSAVIYLMYEVPYQITIKGCNYALRAPYIAKPADFDLKEYFAGVAGKHKKYNFIIEGNQEFEILEYGAKYPIELSPYMLNGKYTISDKIVAPFSGTLMIARSGSLYSLSGAINGSIAESKWVHLATLPTELRPSATYSFSVVSGAINAGMAQITTLGELKVFFKQQESDVHFSFPLVTVGL